MFDWLIVGAGFAGSVLAERIANVRGETVLVIDKRGHIGGNAFDHLNEDGVLIHRYGPHIFHTNAKPVFDYLSRFTSWRPYEHRVLAEVDGRLVPIPINRTTVNALYDLELSEVETEAFLAARAEPIEHPRNAEEKVVSQVGRELYEKFFRTYTTKQWGLDPTELDASVTARIPVRFGDDDRYFSDTYQRMPLKGYTPMFQKMLSHPKIAVSLGMTPAQVATGTYRRMIFTGPIDEYYGCRFGKLPYRSLRFEFETHDRESFQPAAVVNYPQTEQFTRITEYKKLTGQRHAKTTISREFPQAAGEPFYPIPRPENAALFKRYDTLARHERNMWFVGRLANYRYYNMDQVVAQALKTFRDICDTLPAPARRSVITVENSISAS
ncbi:MAG: UDP-galactopyranose mutase [Hyphomicrobiales bacterium]